MPVRRRLGFVLAFLGCAGSAGCVSWLLPFNVGQELIPEGTVIGELPDALLKQVADLDDVWWLEIRRQHAPGTVGGFISSLNEHDGGLVVLFDGASTFQPGGELESALDHYRDYGGDFRAAGFMTWSVVLPECSTPYGQGDLADALEVIDWLDAAGKQSLNVQRVYLVGYSTGATVANLVNLRREVTAIVSMGGLTAANQLTEMRELYEFLTALFPENVGFCQLAASLRAYADPGAPAREQLDIVDHVAELRNPTLFVHGTRDIIYCVENTRVLEARYRELQAAGAPNLPDLQFEYISGGDHFSYRDDPAIRARVVAYLLEFEPEIPSAARADRRRMVPSQRGVGVD